jgi:predicted phosphodiesterase
MKTAIFSDVHGNTPALEAVLENIRRAGVDQVFVLGDVINGVDPAGCLRLLRTWSATEGVPLTCILGNAEMYLLTPDLDNLPDRGGSWQPGVLRLIRWFLAHLDLQDLAWIRTFPSHLAWESACLVHDTPQDRLNPQSWHGDGIEPKYQEWFHHSSGVLEDMPAERWHSLWELMARHRFSHVFCGHSHIAFIRREDGRVVCNTGSVGAPLDGDPRAVWALVKGHPGRDATVALRRVAYNVERLCQMVDAAEDYPDFVEAGSRERYKQWLRTGAHPFAR